MTDYLIIGNGVAGTTAAEYIRKNDATGTITLLTDEDLPYYSRIRLPEYLAKEITEQDLVIKKPDWYEDLKIDLKLNAEVVAADSAKKTVTDQNDRTYAYDKLLIAAGSHSFLPPIKGLDKSGAFSLRNVADVRKISAYAENAENVVLIGGGLLGLECGNAIRKLGKKVSVVEFFPRLLPRQLDVEGAGRLQALMEDMGFAFYLGAKTQEISGDASVSGVLLEGGTLLDAQMVLVSAGVRPNMALADMLGLKKDKGIVIDEFLSSSDSNVFAAGDVAEFNGMPYGIWPAAMEQGKIAGINMAGGSERYAGTTMSNKLKVVGIDLASAGNIDAENEMETKIVKAKDTYQKLVFDNNTIAGCIMLGNTKGFNKIVKMMSDKQNVSDIKDTLITS